MILFTPKCGKFGKLRNHQSMMSPYTYGHCYADSGQSNTSAPNWQNIPWFNIFNVMVGIFSVYAMLYGWN
jgi:hypothetical protein